MSTRRIICGFMALLVLGGVTVMSGCRSQRAIRASMQQFDDYRDRSFAWFEDAVERPTSDERKLKAMTLKHAYQGTVAFTGLLYGQPQPPEKEIRQEMSEAYEVALRAKRLIEEETDVPDVPEPYWQR